MDDISVIIYILDGLHYEFKYGLFVLKKSMVSLKRNQYIVSLGPPS